MNVDAGIRLTQERFSHVKKSINLNVIGARIMQWSVIQKQLTKRMPVRQFLANKVGRNNDILKAGRDLRELKGVSHSDFKGTK